MKYKEGERVLVEVVIQRVDRTAGNKYPYEVKWEAFSEWVAEDDIIGHAPKKPVDWSKVPFGTRVMVGAVPARFLRFAPTEDHRYPLYLLEDNAPEADWYRAEYCELAD